MVRGVRQPKSEAPGYTSVELCAGAGGQALGLHRSGFDHLALVEYDADACTTLRVNGAKWGWADRVHHADLREWSAPDSIGGVDLVAGGVPCPPFSMAGKQLGADDERDLFPALLRIVEELEPRGVQVENVKGLLTKRFEGYRYEIEVRLKELGYVADWRLLNACDFGVPQLRPRTVLVALRPDDEKHFEWPSPSGKYKTVGGTLEKSMASKGWKGAKGWAQGALRIAPTLVGGSKKHGGADLGPTRAKEAWAKLGVDAHGLANDLPGPGFEGMPRLTVEQAALIQGFPASWAIQGRKTSAYRQVGNAFPPPVAEAVGRAIVKAFQQRDAEIAES